MTSLCQGDCTFQRYPSYPYGDGYSDSYTTVSHQVQPMAIRGNSSNESFHSGRGRQGLGALVVNTDEDFLYNETYGSTHSREDPGYDNLGDSPGHVSGTRVLPRSPSLYSSHYEQSIYGGGSSIFGYPRGRSHYGLSRQFLQGSNASVSGRPSHGGDSSVHGGGGGGGGGRGGATSPRWGQVVGYDSAVVQRNHQGYAPSHGVDVGLQVQQDNGQNPEDSLHQWQMKHMMRRARNVMEDTGRNELGEMESAGVGDEWVGLGVGSGGDTRSRESSYLTVRGGRSRDGAGRKIGPVRKGVIRTSSAYSTNSFHSQHELAHHRLMPFDGKILPGTGLDRSRQGSFCSREDGSSSRPAGLAAPRHRPPTRVSQSSPQS